MHFLKKYTIVSVGRISMENCIAVELISDDPKQLIKEVMQNKGHSVLDTESINVYLLLLTNTKMVEDVI